MVELKTKVSVKEKFVSHIADIIGIVVFLVIVSNYFIQGGIPQTNTFIQWISWTTPFATLVVSLILIRKKFVSIVKRQSGFVYDSIFFVTFAGMFILGLIETMSGFVWYNLYFSISLTGMATTYGTVAFGCLIPMMKMYKFKSPQTILLVAISIISFMSYSMLNLFFGLRPVIELNQYLTGYLTGRVDSVYWAAACIGALAGAARILTFRQKLRPD